MERITLAGKKPWEKKNVPSQDQMDKLTIGFCEKLNVVNGFVTDISAGHVIRIGKEEHEMVFCKDASPDADFEVI